MLPSLESIGSAREQTRLTGPYQVSDAELTPKYKLSRFFRVCMMHPEFSVGLVVPFLVGEGEWCKVAKSRHSEDRWRARKGQSEGRPFGCFASTFAFYLQTV
jgi:hypothetical protein